MTTTKKVSAKSAPEASEKLTPSTILTVWQKTDKEKDSDALVMNFKMLKANAEEQTLKYQQQVLAANKSLEVALNDSCKNPNFKKIHEAMLDVEAAELNADRAKSTYYKLFGTVPTIAI